MVRYGLAILMAIALIGCGETENNGGGTTTGEDSTTASKPTVKTIQARPEAPAIQKITTFKMTPDDQDGKLLEEQFFDGNGRIVKDVDYDFFGDGGVYESMAYKYNDNGKVKERITVPQNGQNITDTYTYNEANHLVEHRITGGEDAGIYRYSYDEHNNVTRKEYLTPDGELVKEMTWKLTYEGENLVKKEEYKAQAGDEPQLVSTLAYVYKGDKMIKESLLDANGETLEYDEMTYNELGQLVVSRNYEGDKLVEEEHTTYNDYGEITKVEGRTAPNEFTQTYTYDEFGTRVASSFKDNNGDEFSERMDVVYNR